MASSTGVARVRSSTASSNRKDEKERKRQRESTISSDPVDVSEETAVLVIPSSSSKRRNRGEKIAATDEKKQKEKQIIGKNNEKPNKKPLKGMVIAITTLATKGKAHSNSETSYRSVVDRCKLAGATVTNQVHKRVSCVISTRSAVQHGTQRVRKALKKNIPIIDIEWLTQCQADGTRVDHETFSLDELAKEMIRNKSISTGTSQAGDLPREIPSENAPDDIGWSEPAELGCCCVCHENGDDSCAWCTDCSINLSKGGANRKFHS